MATVIEAHDAVADTGTFTCPAGTEALIVGVHSYYGAGGSSTATCTYNGDSMTLWKSRNKNVGGAGAEQMDLFILRNPDTGSAYTVDYSVATSTGSIALCVAVSGTDIPNRQVGNEFGAVYDVSIDTDSDGGDKTMTVRGSDGGMLLGFWGQWRATTPAVGGSGEQTLMDTDTHYTAMYHAGDGANEVWDIDSNSSATGAGAWIIVDVPPGRSASSTYKVSIDDTYIQADDTGLAVPIFGTFDGTGGDVVNLKSSANGGEVTAQHYSRFAIDNLIPADVWFTSDQEGTTQLEHSVIEWNPSTGYFYAWVKTALDSTNGTDIYMWVGDSGAGVHEGWDTFSDFWYISPDGGEYCYTAPPYYSIGQLSSTATAILDRSGTLSSSATWSGAGKASSQALSCAGGDDGLAAPLGYTASDAPDDRTVWTLFKPASGGDTDPRLVRGRFAYGLDLFIDTSNARLYLITRENYNGTLRAAYTSDSAIADDTWYFSSFVWDSSDNYHKAYLNGATTGTDTAFSNGAKASGESTTGGTWGETYAGVNNYSGLIELNAIIFEAWIDESKTVYNLFFSQSSAVAITSTGIKIPTATITVTGYAPTIGTAVHKVVPAASVTVTGLVPYLTETIGIPKATIVVTAHTPLVGDEVLHVRSADGTELFGTVTAGNACMIISKGDKWYILDMPSL